MQDAYAYFRFSTDAQADGDSFRRQRDLLRLRAAEFGCDVANIRELTDPGVSAYRGANIDSGALGQFVRAAEAGEICRGTILFMESLDRMSRQPTRKSIELLIRLGHAGIDVITLADGKRYEANGADTLAWISSLFILGRAHEESETKSRRLKAAWDEKRRNATKAVLTAQLPGWLYLANDRSSIGVIADRAAVVLRIYELSASGFGANAITRRLNDEGVQPFGRSKRWVQSYIVKILSSRAVLGEYQPHRKIDGKRIPEGRAIDNYFPAVVSADLYLRAQFGRHKRANIGGGRKGKGLTNLFTGLAKCGYCGEPMRYINKGDGSRNGRPHLRCRASLEGTLCVPSGWAYDDFEASFLQYVEEIDIAAIFGGEGDNARIRHLDEQIVATSELLRQSMMERERAYEMIRDPDLDAAFLRTKLRECEASISTWNNRLAALQHEADDVRARMQESPRDVKALLSRVNALDDRDRYVQRSRLASRLADLIEDVSLRVRGDEPAWNMNGSIVRMKDSPTFVVRFKNGITREVVVARTGPSRLLALMDTSDGTVLRFRWKDRLAFNTSPAVADTTPQAS